MTSRRILILSKSSLKSVELRQLSEMDLIESADGSGSLAFGPAPVLGLFQRGQGFGPWSGTPLVPTFEKIAGVNQVHALIRRAQADLERAA